MTYTSEILTWQSYEIEVRCNPDPFNLVSRHQEAMAHVEIRTLKPEKAPLPITETGYRDPSPEGGACPGDRGARHPKKVPKILLGAYFARDAT